MFPNALTVEADIVLPFCAWLERDGCFVNHDGKIQPFSRAINPPEGAMRDGQYLFTLAGFEGLYTAERVRKLMAESMPAHANLHVPPAKPAHQH